MPIYRARAPVRIDFLGGGSDAPPFSREYGGAVINAGVTRYAACSLEIADAIGGAEIHSLDLNETVRAEAVEALEFDGNLDLIKAALKRSGIRGSLRCRTRVDVPPQSGLGASATLSVAVIAAGLHAQGRAIDPHEIVELANEAEREDLGQAGGRQDPCGAAFGGLGYYEFKDPAFSHEPIELEHELICELEHNLLLAYTGLTHLSGDIHKDIRSAYADDASPCKKAMFGLARIAREGRELLNRGDLRGFAELWNENWRCHKDLHRSCTNERLERIFEIGAACGIVGGKTCGAGGGGCVVFYCGEGRKRELEQALTAEDCRIMPVQIAREGVRAWSVERANAQ